MTQGKTAAYANDRHGMIERAVDRWCAQLVDLSGRNNLLHFRLEGVPKATLDLRVPAETRLVNPLLTGSPVTLNELFPNADQERLAMAERAQAVAAQALRNKEEKGLQTSYLAWGLASWTEGSNSSDGPPICAPVLMRTVRLASQLGGGDDIEIVPTGQWELNQTLQQVLLLSFGIEIDGSSLNGIEKEVASGKAVSAFDVVIKQAERVPEFRIDPALALANFSYPAFALVDDLRTGIDALATSDLVSAIAGDPGARDAVRSHQASIQIESVDEQDPADEFLVLNSDSHQSDVINSVVAGASVVVDGPPGTGKSQMIANLIASLSAAGRTTLFVAEKRAAIDAVLNRLEAVGLGDLVMDLHEQTSSREALAEELQKVVRPQPGESSVMDVDLKGAVMARRAALRRHVDALKNIRQPWGISLGAIYAELPDYDDLPAPGIRIDLNSLETIKAEDLDDLRQDLERFVDAGGLKLGETSGPWSAAVFSGELARPDQTQAVTDVLRRLRDTTLPAAAEQLAALREEIPLPPQVNDGGLGQWIQILTAIRDLTKALGMFHPDVFALPLDRFEVGRGSGTPPDFGALRQFARSNRPVTLMDVRALAELADRWEHLVGGPVPAVGWDGAVHALTIWRQLEEEVAQLASATGNHTLGNCSFGDLGAQVELLASSEDFLSRVPQLLAIAERMRAMGLGPVLDTVQELGLNPGQASALLRRAWLHSVMDEVHKKDPATWVPSVEDLLNFRALDRRLIEANPGRIRALVADRINDVQASFPEEALLVESQIRKRRNRLSVERLLDAAPQIMTARKPCWAMSPLRVPELLPIGIQFDVVVFDEGSQIVPAAAISAIARGRQLVVVGDPHQLPPTTFFQATHRSELEELEPEGSDLTSDFESILDVVTSFFTPPIGHRTLSWHYRSKDERLIAFSNNEDSLYAGSLTTFPGTAVESAVRLELAPPSAREDDPTNSSSSEVELVVKLARRHASERPDRSLGIIALGIEHAERIESGLRQAAERDPSLRTFLTSSPAGERLFVKNLERVQGDEREDIILSFGYHAGSDGVLRYRFGPINGAGGERRLNVAVTRARSTMTVVSSFSADDLAVDRLNGEGPQMLRRLLTYAASGGTELSQKVAPPVATPLEQKVYNHLLESGLPARLHYGTGWSYIDIALGDGHDPGHLVLAVMTDGASYTRDRSVRDRERLRPEQLERLGWTVFRLPSRLWFEDPMRVISEVREYFEQANAASSDRR